MKEALARERKTANRAGFVHPTVHRYGERIAVERVNGCLKDEFGCVMLTDASAAGESLAERKGSHHFHREPCVGHREVSGESSVAACAGRAIEPRKS